MNDHATYYGTPEPNPTNAPGLKRGDVWDGKVWTGTEWTSLDTGEWVPEGAFAILVDHRVVDYWVPSGLFITTEVEE